MSRASASSPNPTASSPNPIISSPSTATLSTIHPSITPTPSAGHFIDTLWDVVDLGVDLGNCLGDTDSLSCYMLAVDAAAVIIPGLTGVGGADNAIRAARGADDLGGGGRFIPPGGASGGGDDFLEKFVKERLGTAPQNINCYGCVLKEWPEALGNPAIIDDLRPNPWIGSFDDFVMSGGRSDQIREALNLNFDEIAIAELKRGNLISWHDTFQRKMGTFDIANPKVNWTVYDYSYTTHIGIYLGNNQVFSKLGWSGAYEILTLDDAMLTHYGSKRFWKSPWQLP